VEKQLIKQQLSNISTIHPLFSLLLLWCDTVTKVLLSERYGESTWFTSLQGKPDHTTRARHMRQPFPSTHRPLNHACQNPGEETHTVNPCEPSEPEGEYNPCHHSTPGVASHSSKSHCKSGTSVYWFPFSQHVTSTVQTWPTMPIMVWSSIGTDRAISETITWPTI
jgi:hypothetical protein